MKTQIRVVIKKEGEDDQWQEVAGYTLHACPGLAVTPWMNGYAPAGKGWTITHRHSGGMLLSRPLGSRAEALRVMRLLATTGPDWNHPFSVIQTYLAANPSSRQVIMLDLRRRAL